MNHKEISSLRRRIDEEFESFIPKDSFYINDVKTTGITFWADGIEVYIENQLAESGKYYGIAVFEYETKLRWFKTLDQFFEDAVSRYKEIHIIRTGRKQ